MGKWKYLNWLITVIVLAHMYRYFFVRYQASASVYILSTIGWLLLGAVGYYIFVFRMRQPDKVQTRPTAKTTNQNTSPRERPKVVFRKKNADGK